MRDLNPPTTIAEHFDRLEKRGVNVDRTLATQWPADSMDTSNDKSAEHLRPSRTFMEPPPYTSISHNTQAITRATGTPRR